MLQNPLLWNGDDNNGRYLIGLLWGISKLMIMKIHRIEPDSIFLVGILYYHFIIDYSTLVNIILHPKP